MKTSKILFPIILIAFLCLSWFSFITGSLSENTAYRTCIRNAEDSIEVGLYEQAVEFYKESLQYEDSPSTYLKIKDTYDTLYAEEHTPFIRNLYIEDMAAAAGAYPQNETFWLAQIDLYMDAENYSKAYETVKRAMNYGAKSDALDNYYTTLLYMVKTDYNLYSAFKTALNGYITVFDGNDWYVLDDAGEEITSNYSFIGLINDDGKGLYTNSIDTRLLDATEVPRARFQITPEDAGYYNERSDLLPVKINGVWKYMNSEGEFLPGEFEIAGSFYNHRAAAYADGKWVLVDEDGEQTVLSDFEDIKLDLYGSYIQNDVILAKSGGKYRIYDTEFNQISDFAADDIDICIDPERIAYADGGKWGFVSATGEVVLEPEYAKAKSFANGYAAVCDNSGRWGFITDEYQRVIDFQYLDAHYFTASESCLVSKTEGTVQRLYFMFE